MSEAKKTVTLYPTNGQTGASHDGESYTVDEKTGAMEVPESAVPELLQHGFSTSKPKAEKK